MDGEQTDSKKATKEINDIRALLSMDPDDKEFKDAWRRFQAKRGAGGLITARIVQSRAKVEIMLCAELLVDILKGCREVAVDEKSTPAERNKAAELAIMALKAHENLDKRLGELVDCRKPVEQKDDEKKEEPQVSPTPPVETPAPPATPRFYEHNGD